MKLKGKMSRLIAVITAVLVMAVSLPLYAFADNYVIQVHSVPSDVGTITVYYNWGGSHNFSIDDTSGNTRSDGYPYGCDDDNIYQLVLNWTNGAKTTLTKSAGQFTASAMGNGTINVFIAGSYSMPAAPTLNVNYYKNSVSGANFIASIPYTRTITTGDQITLASGTSVNQLNYEKPSGYGNGVQQSPVPLTIQNGYNEIDVVYSALQQTVTVNYYKDSVTNTGDSTHFLGSSTYSPTVYTDSQITLAAGTSANQLDFKKPSGYDSGVQQGVPYVVASGANVINVLYAPSAQTVTVNYYKGSVTNTGDSTHFLGSSTYSPTVYTNSQITLAAGTSANQLDYQKPAGYGSGVQQGGTYTVVPGTNVINVLYTATNQTIVVNYYKGSVTNTGDAAHFIGTQPHSPAPTDSTITLNGTELNAMQPPAGYGNGTQVGGTYTVTAGTNVINVLYSPLVQTVTINYYKGSVTNTGDNAHFLGSSAYAPTVYTDDQITLAAGTSANRLDFLKPDGYGSGVQQGGTYTVTVGTNVINVLYTAEQQTVTVNYYKNSVSGANFLGTSDYAPTPYTDDLITLAAGTSANQLNYKQPDGYSNGIQVGGTYTVIAGTNVINVIYTAEQQNVTINYYKGSVTDTTDAAHFLGTLSYLPTVYTDQTVDLTTSELNAKQPLGYGNGVQVGGTYTVTAGTNVINVLYSPLVQTVTVNYYKNSVADANLLGTSDFSPAAYTDDEITLAAGTSANQLNYKHPDGYSDGVQQGVPYHVVYGTNVINVVYTALQRDVTINYYKGSVTDPTDTTHFINTASYSGTVRTDETITLNTTELNAYMPAGYSGGVQVGGTYTVVAGTNVINVLYTAEQRNVTINYYKGSVADANFIDSDQYAGTVYTDNLITLTSDELNAHHPDGYSNGVQQGDIPYTVTAEDNIINVLYTPIDYTVTVNYYQGSIAASNLLGSSVLSTTAHVGDTISLAAGTLDGQLDFMKPASGYVSGVQQGTIPFTVVVSDNNVISVVYFAELIDDNPPLTPPEQPQPEQPQPEQPQPEQPQPEQPQQPQQQTIPDEDAPLAPAKTGDSTNASAIAIALLSLLALGGVAVIVKKRIEK